MVEKSVLKGNILLYSRYVFFYSISTSAFLLILLMVSPPLYVWPLFIIMIILPFSIYFSLKALHYTLPGAPTTPSVRQRFTAITTFFLGMGVYGSIPYVVSGDASLFNALFESISSVTTTSFTVLPPSTHTYIHFWRSFQSWQGALFYLLMISDVLKEYWDPKAESLAQEIPLKFPLMSYRGTMLSIAIVFFVFLTAVIFLLLLPVVGMKNALGLSLAISSTGGVSVYGNTLPDDPLVYFVATSGLILASLNVLEVVRSRFRRKKGMKELLESHVYLIILGASSLFYVVWHMITGRGPKYGLFALVSSSSGGGIYPSGWPGGFDDFTLLVIMLLMLVGGSTFSLTSGFKVRRLIVIVKAVYGELLRAIHPQAYLEGDMRGERLFFQSTIFIFFLYLMVVLLGSVALIGSGMGIRDGIFLTASALTNTGLDPGALAGGTNSFTLFQKGLFMVIMIVGRLDVLIPIFLLSPSLKRFS